MSVWWHLYGIRHPVRLRQHMGENGLRLAQMYSWESWGEKVERTIQCILQGQPLPADLTLGG
jgi:hypothetical protein